MKGASTVQQEFALINELKPMQKLDYFDMCTQFPSASSVINFNRNRYRDVLAEENTRVRLQYFQEEESDYINANFIQVHKQKYISCQAPLPSTTSHFWSMIWEQKSPVIVMLTRIVEGDRKKADVYWPAKENESITSGSLTVTLKSFTKLQFITIRVLAIACSSAPDDTREVVHLHYTEWPDFGVPAATLKIRELIRLMEFYKERAQSKGSSGPVVCHCSAGIGRCGTFVGVLVALEKLTEGIDYEDIDLVTIVTKMRSARCGMVQTESQYKFIYQVLEDIVKEKQLKGYRGNPCKRLMLCHSCDELPFDRDNEDLKDRRCGFSLSADIPKRASQEIACKP